MKTQLFLTGLLIISQLLFSQENLFVSVDADRITIWNTNADRNCGSKFDMQVYKNDSIINVFEVDTARNLALCNCVFDLSVTISMLPAGNYTVDVYRVELNLWANDPMYPPDTSYLGRTTFAIAEKGNDESVQVLSAYQSECLKEPGINEKFNNFNKFDLSNYPNPFDKATTINYNLPDRDFVTLKIYDYAGREVALLINEMQTKDHYRIFFDAYALNNGIYFVNLKSSQFSETKKIVLIK